MNPDFDGHEGVKNHKEYIENSIWRPGILAPFEESVGAGMTTKPLKEELIGITKGLRITGDPERFDENLGDLPWEKQLQHLFGAKILTSLLKELDPETNSHNIIKTALKHGNKIVNVDDEYLKKNVQRWLE